MGLFEGKKGLILGVFNDHSIAWAIGKTILSEGGQVGFSYFPDKPEDTRTKNRGRLEKLTAPYAANTKFLHPVDVSKDADVTSLAEKTAAEFGKIDFLLHSIANAPLDELKKDTVAVSREGFRHAMDVSVYSFLTSVNSVKHLFNPGASVLTLTYFGGEKVVPGYNLMGVCKAALDCAMKYTAYDLGPQGVRVNAISAGPVRSMSGRGAGVDDMLRLYEAMSPIGKNIDETELSNSGTFLLSHLSGGITGEILHLDYGYNVMGSPGRAIQQLGAATPSS